MNVLARAQRSDDWNRVNFALLRSQTSKLGTCSFEANFILLLLQQVINPAFFFTPLEVDLENAQYELELLEVSLVHGSHQLVVYLWQS